MSAPYECPKCGNEHADPEDVWNCCDTDDPWAPVAGEFPEDFEFLKLLSGGEEGSGGDR